MEYYTSLLVNHTKTPYSLMKINAILPIMRMHNTQVNAAVDHLTDATEKLRSCMTMQHIPILDKLNSTKKFLSHFQRLSQEFIDELEVQKGLKEKANQFD